MLSKLQILSIAISPKECVQMHAKSSRLAPIFEKKQAKPVIIASLFILKQSLGINAKNYHTLSAVTDT
jgi:hypothetical protein